MTANNLREVAIVVVLTVWSLTSIRALISGDPVPFQTATTIAFIVLGALFAPSLRKRNGNGDAK